VLVFAGRLAPIMTATIETRSSMRLLHACTALTIR
jgi:hypothetical protein